jgi:hypothetical protein
MPSVLWSRTPSPHQQHVDCHFRFLFVLSCGPNTATDNSISAPANFYLLNRRGGEEAKLLRLHDATNYAKQVSCPTNRAAC